MMNDVAVMCNAVALPGTESRQRAKTIYAMCRAVTPQFYKHTKDEIKQSVDSIQILTEGINPILLAKMCDIAIKAYPKTRSAKSNQYFDVNYILTFYEQARADIRPNDFNVLLGRRNGVDLWGKIEFFDYENGYPDDAPIWKDLS